MAAAWLLVACASAFVAPRPRIRTTPRAVPISTPALRTASTAVLRLVSVCGIGIGYARLGVLDRQACAILSRLIFYVFQPAMLFVNCAHTIATTSRPAALAVLPFFAGVQIALGAVFGAVALRVLKSDSRELRALCAFGNAGPLPFVFAQQLFAADPDTLARAVAYISFYLVGWSPVFWTLGPQILLNRQGQGRTQLLSPPVLASLGGVVVGATPLCRDLLYGAARPLHDSLRLLGTAYLPSVALVLAGTLARALFNTTTTPPERRHLMTKAEKASSPRPALSTPTRLVALALCRFFWLPFATATLLHLTTPRFFPTDNLMRFVLLMAASMPSAQNALVILQLDASPDVNDSLAPSMARILALLYLIAVPFMTILLSIATQLAPLDL